LRQLDHAASLSGDGPLKHNRPQCHDGRTHLRLPRRLADGDNARQSRDFSNKPRASTSADDFARHPRQ